MLVQRRSMKFFVGLAELATTFSDLEIICEDGTMLWNKSLLAVWSPFIRNLLSQSDLIVLDCCKVKDVTKCFTLLCDGRGEKILLWSRELVNVLELLLIPVGEFFNVVKEELDEMLEIKYDLIETIPSLFKVSDISISGLNILEEEGEWTSAKSKISCGLSEEKTLNPSDCLEEMNQEDYSYPNGYDEENSENDDPTFKVGSATKYKINKEVKAKPTKENNSKNEEGKLVRRKRSSRSKKLDNAVEDDEEKDGNDGGGHFRGGWRMESQWKDCFSKEPSPPRFVDGIEAKYYYLTQDSIQSRKVPQHCLLCSYKSDSRKNVQTHFKRIHSKEKLYKCNDCEKKFSSVGSVVSHWRRVHDSKSENKKYVCDTCGKTYELKSELKNHVVSHSGEVFTCQYCQKGFNTPIKRDAHEKRHLTERVPCNICGKSFVDSKAAEEHELRMHIGSKPVNCDECGKSYTSIENLKFHKRTQHTSVDKPYNCSICGALFRTPSTLKYHTDTVHLKANLFQCPYCDQILSKKDKFKRHSMRKHDGKELPDELKIDRSISGQTIVKINQDMPFSN